MSRLSPDAAPASLWPLIKYLTRYHILTLKNHTATSPLTLYIQNIFHFRFLTTKMRDSSNIFTIKSSKYLHFSSHQTLTNTPSTTLNYLAHPPFELPSQQPESTIIKMLYMIIKSQSSIISSISNGWERFEKLCVAEYVEYSDDESGMKWKEKVLVIVKVRSASQRKNEGELEVISERVTEGVWVERWLSSFQMI